MNEFQRREVEGRPLDEQIDNEPHRSKPSQLAMEKLPQAMHFAKESEGDEAKDAWKQVLQGKARTQELLEWIDDLRSGEDVRGGEVIDKEKTEPETHKTGFLDDFAPDSQIAAGDIDNPPNPIDDPATQAAQVAFAIDDDLDFMFPGRKKKKPDGTDDDDDENGDGTGTEAPAKTDEKSKKS